MKDGKDGDQHKGEITASQFASLTLNSLTVLSFLGGPEGIVVAAGLTFASGLIGMTEGAGSKVASVATQLREVHLKGRLLDLVNSLQSFIDTVNNKRIGFDNIARNSADLAKVSLVSPTPSIRVSSVANQVACLTGESFRGNLSWRRRHLVTGEFANEDQTKRSIELLNLFPHQPFVDWLRLHTLGGTDDKLATCQNRLQEWKDSPPWSQPEVRIAMLHADSMLWLAYKLLALGHLRLAAIAYYRNKQQPDQLYRGNIEAAVCALDSMRSTMQSRRETAEERMKSVAEKRRQAVPKEFETEIIGGWLPEFVYKLTDNETGKEVFRAYGHSGGNPDPEARQRYMDGLERHIERVFKLDRTILDSWKTIESEIDSILKPPTPRDAPIHETVSSILVDVGSQ
jgi:hypothetical protein